MRFKDFNSGENKIIDGANCFIPSYIGDSVYNGDNQIDLLLSKSSWNLGKLNALSNYLPDTQLFFSMLMFEEAKKSNEIEGTMTDMKGVGDPVSSKANQNADKKIMNYLEAFNFGVDYLKDNNFTHELLKELHKRLFAGIDEENINPGEYKVDQNWIGGASKYDARFIPPPPFEVQVLMEDLLDFLNNDSNEMSDLIKIGIAHYQFETIHPFNDGNGRLGRMLIGLYLIKKGIVHYPIFISNFLSRFRREYYFNLDSVRYKNEMEQWVKFFLNVLKEATKETLKILDNVLELKKSTETQITDEFGGNSTYPIQLIKLLYKSPFINSSMAVKELDISAATANSILKKLEAMEIIKEITNQKRNKVYLYEKYLEIFKTVSL